MALEDDLKTEVATIFRSQWSKRSGQVVPEPSDLKLGNDAVEFESATVLYADLDGSTGLVSSSSWGFAAEIYKTFLLCATRLIRAEGGTITSYDGDRVMGIFIGDSPNTRAARCGLKINYAVKNIINPGIRMTYKDSTFTVKHVVGIDTSSIRAARTGVRGDNDIVWVGEAANHAAKLTALNLEQSTWITKAVYEKLQDGVRLGGAQKEPMWKSFTWTKNGDRPIYGSTWWWQP